MRSIIKLIALFLLIGRINFTNAQKTEYHAWWHDTYLRETFETPNKKKLPLIKVAGNRFVDETGDTILFRGVSISDPDKIEKQGHWNKRHFEKVKELGTMIIRIPVHPVAWRERGAENYLKLLDQAIDWCTELGMYVIIDWHTIGNLGMELFQDPMYETTKKETFEFWRTIARRYSGNNTVAFYELFNEPTLFFNQLGTMSWAEWKELNEKMITLIRAYDNETIPLVAGFDWAYDLTPLLIEPVEAENIGYVTHPYPHKRTKPWEPKWEENFGFAAQKYPIIATEIGFTMDNESINSNGEYGEAIINYLESRGISWVWWVFDPEWHPKMFKSWDTYELTDSGNFYKAVMQEKK
ncbi:glycoside hydrolase family 5 protein [Melioribacter sp. OK-6-Me]|uniref:glycoside hydrolase family 5 protein n=1 Tax=unclassified Melioribacter TaxID=2627329 RepID=UPI003ED9EF78